LEFTRYVRLLLKSARTAASFWDELAKRDPHETTLLKQLADLEEMDSRIRNTYNSITERHSLSTALMDPITKNYCQLVLNVGEDEPIHVVKKAKEEKKQGNTNSLHEETRLFSADSRTPICLISAEGSSLG
jgi:hypothetical protein